jgi:hypothetical protein
MFGCADTIPGQAASTPTEAKRTRQAEPGRDGPRQTEPDALAGAATAQRFATGGEVVTPRAFMAFSRDDFDARQPA